MSKGKGMETSTNRMVAKRMGACGISIFLTAYILFGYTTAIANETNGGTLVLWFGPYDCLSDNINDCAYPYCNPPSFDCISDNGSLRCCQKGQTCENGECIGEPDNDVANPDNPDLDNPDNPDPDNPDPDNPDPDNPDPDNPDPDNPDPDNPDPDNPDPIIPDPIIPDPDTPCAKECPDEGGELYYDIKTRKDICCCRINGEDRRFINRQGDQDCCLKGGTLHYNWAGKEYEI